MRLLSILIVLFTLFEAIGYFIAKDFRDMEIDGILDNSFNLNQILYRSILSSFESHANLIFDNIMEKQTEIENILYKVNNENIDKTPFRKELFNLIDKKFIKYQNKYSVQQIHFHLPDGTSFLQFDKSDNFGESLWNSRASLREIHSKHQIIRGFEEDKFFNGFRNIYPIFKNNLYVGSVEISFSFKSIRDKAVHLLPFHYEFIINKNNTPHLWKEYKNINYTTSKLSENFYYDNNINSCNNHCSENINFENCLSQINHIISKKIENRLNNFSEFSLFTEYESQFFTISFIPIQNILGKNSAYFIIYDRHNKLIQKEFETMNQRVVIFTFVLIICLTLIYLFIIKELEIRELNSKLEKRINIEIERNRAKDRVILQQSKFSAMAEMINSIAHQWRQPLNRISLEMINIEEDFIYDDLNETMLTEYSERINGDIQYLSKTIDDFREFYKPTDKQESINILNLITSTLNMIKSSLNDSKVDITFKAELKAQFYINYGKELKQVLNNLVNNAIDSVDRYSGKVEVTLVEFENIVEITIKDNGKGIKDEIADRIFEPYFTTKFESQGTGMGLYVSKIIVEINMNGEISFEHNKKGTSFKIKLPKQSI